MPVNSSVRRSRRPRVRISRAPDTERDSSTDTVSSARACCWRAVTSRLARETRRVTHTATGTTSTDRRDRRHDRATIATAVATAVVRFAAMPVATSVMTPPSPPTSLSRREVISPPRVRVKKPRDWSWRRSKTFVRSWCMKDVPTRVETRVWTTPITCETRATPTIPPTSTTSRRTSPSGMAWSTVARSRKGWAIETSEEATMSTTTVRSARRWGRSSVQTLRHWTGEVATWARSSALAREVRRGPPPPGADAWFMVTSRVTGDG